MGGHEGRHELKREMGLASATFLVVANMVGSGIFTTSGLIMEDLRDPQAMLLCWVIGGAFALCGALCYGELGAMFPRAGGEYVFLSESFGKLMGFLSGWISLIVGFSAPIAAAAIAFVTYFARAFTDPVAQRLDAPLIQSGSVSISSLTLLAVGTIALFAVVHSHSLNLGSRVQNLLTLFKIAIILFFVAMGLGSGHGSTAHFTSARNPGHFFSAGLASSLIFISFAYSGWNAAVYLGGEIRNPARNIPLSLLIGTLMVTVLYLFMNVTYIYALPAEEMSGVLEIGAKSATALFGVRMGKVFSMAVAVCIFSVTGAMMMAGPRIYYAMARDGTFFQGFGKATGGHRTPAPAIWLQGGIASAMVLTSSFDKLLLYIGFTLSLFAMLTVAGVILLRIKRPALDRRYKTFGYPVTPVFFILGNLWVTVYFIVRNPLIAFYGAGTILAGIFAFGFFRWYYRKARI